MSANNLEKSAVTPNSQGQASPQSTFSLGMLVALVVGSMIGGGIFALPQTMSATASAGAILIGWAITGLGMMTLALVFQTLASRKPELDAGVYAYAKASFGNFIGFSSAWGYWISAWIGNVSYLVLLFGTLGYFVPAFGEKGNSPLAIGGASVVLWILHFFIARGVKQAAIINQITTIAKVIPLIVFIVLCGLTFNSGIFTQDFWGKATPSLGSVLDQVKACMLMTVWTFVGIEGASVYSSRARKRSDVGKATVLGFFGVLALLILVNVISLGIMTQPELAKLENPSVPHVMAKAVGEWGATFISVGIAISLAGALLSWMLLCAEILYASAKDRTMPNFLRKTNRKDVPINALWATTLAIQAFLVVTLVSEASYSKLLYLATSMILVPYFLSALYGFMLAHKGETYENQGKQRSKDWVIGLVAVLYSAWLLYAAGIKYLLLSSLLYAVGILLYIKARKEKQATLFTPAEKAYAVLIVLAAVYALVQIFMGHLTIN